MAADGLPSFISMSLSFRSLRTAYSPSSASTRRSNMELLRIVAMTMIVCGHFFYHGFDHTLKPTAVYRALAPLHICGVNLFFLISGWFGIRFSLRSLVRLVGITFFFSALNVGLIALCGLPVEHHILYDLFLFPVSRGGYWFIMVYCALMILSPLLNAGMAAVGRTRFDSFMVLFTFLTLYSCGIGGNYVNVNGYTIMQAVWLYLVAAWLRQHPSTVGKIPTWCLPVGFIVFSCATGALFASSADYSWINYNAPLVACASLCMFLWFTRFDFTSRAVNLLAPAAFGCYLLQDGLFGRKVVYDWMEHTYRGIMAAYPGVTGGLVTAAGIVALLAAIWGASWLLTPAANAFGSRLGDIASRLNRRVRSLLASRR